jgi:hypothetical protein
MIRISVFLHISILDHLATNPAGALGIDLVALGRAILEPGGIYGGDQQFVLC